MTEAEEEISNVVSFEVCEALRRSYEFSQQLFTTRDALIAKGRETLMRLERIQWDELTREQQIENLEALAVALLFMRMFETDRFDLEDLFDKASAVDPLDIESYVDCVTAL